MNLNSLFFGILGAPKGRGYCFTFQKHSFGGRKRNKWGGFFVPPLHEYGGL